MVLSSPRSSVVTGIVCSTLGQSEPCKRRVSCVLLGCRRGSSAIQSVVERRKACRILVGLVANTGHLIVFNAWRGRNQDGNWRGEKR